MMATLPTSATAAGQPIRTRRSVRNASQQMQNIKSGVKKAPSTKCPNMIGPAGLIGSGEKYREQNDEPDCLNH